MNIPNEIIYSICNNYLNCKEISNMLLCNKSFKKLLLRLYTGYIGNIFFFYIEGESALKKKRDNNQMIYNFDYFINNSNSQSFINYLKYIIYICDLFGEHQNKNIQLQIGYKTILEYGLVNRVKRCSFEKTKVQLLEPNIFRGLQKNIYSKWNIKRDYYKNRFLRKNFRFVYSIIIH